MVEEFALRTNATVFLDSVLAANPDWAIILDVENGPAVDAVRIALLGNAQKRRFWLLDGSDRPSPAGTQDCSKNVGPGPLVAHNWEGPNGNIGPAILICAAATLTTRFNALLPRLAWDCALFVRDVQNLPRG
jgi:hypothetical protein